MYQKSSTREMHQKPTRFRHSDCLMSHTFDGHSLSVRRSHSLYAETPKDHKIRANEIVDARTLPVRIQLWLEYEGRPWEGCHVPELGS